MSPIQLLRLQPRPLIGGITPARHRPRKQGHAITRGPNPQPRAAQRLPDPRQLLLHFGERLRLQLQGNSPRMLTSCRLRRCDHTGHKRLLELLHPERLHYHPRQDRQLRRVRRNTAVGRTHILRSRWQCIRRTLCGGAAGRHHPDRLWVSRHPSRGTTIGERRHRHLLTIGQGESVRQCGLIRRRDPGLGERRLPHLVPPVEVSDVLVLGAHLVAGRAGHVLVVVGVLIKHGADHEVVVNDQHLLAEQARQGPDHGAAPGDGGFGMGGHHPKAGESLVVISSALAARGIAGS